MIAGVCGHAADEVLRDGAAIHIRAIRPDDKERLLEHFHALGPRSVYYRFHVFARCGFAITRSFDAGVVHVAFPTAEAPR